MRNNNRQIIIFTVIIIAICFISVIVFTLPSFIEQFNLSTKSNIGSAIGGITAPVIGIVSSILLYLALTRQTQSNIDQRLKNESDIIFLLLNQLDNEISSFYYNFTETKGTEKKEFNYTGVQGLNVFVQKLKAEHALSNFKYTFKAFYQSNQILLIIRSFLLIEKRIEISQLSQELKDMFKQKLDSVYQCRLKESFKQLLEVIDKNPHVKDSVSQEMNEFYKGHN